MTFIRSIGTFFPAWGFGAHSDPARRWWVRTIKQVDNRLSYMMYIIRWRIRFTNVTARRRGGCDRADNGRPPTERAGNPTPLPIRYDVVDIVVGPQDASYTRVRVLMFIGSFMRV